MDNIALIIITAIVALLGVVVGAQVQKVCKFIFPTDFITLTIFAAMLANGIFNAVHIEWMWYIPFAIGYLVGYLIVGRTTYTMCIEMPDPMHLKVTHKVFYEWDGRTYIQEQNNRALIDRLIFRIEHEIDSNVPIVDDKIVTYKRPMFPLFEDRAVLIESLYTTHIERKGWLFRHNVYMTSIDLAYGSTVSKMQLLYDFGKLRELQTQIIDLTAEVHRLESETGPRMLEHALQIDTAVKKTSVPNRALHMAKVMEEARRKIPKVEGESTQGDDTNGDA